MVGHATAVGCASTEELKASGFTALRSSDGGLEDVECGLGCAEELRR